MKPTKPTKHLDFYHECNDKKIPEADFRMQFCDRCMQQECLRSQFGKSKFDLRVSTWQERLFDNVPKIDPTSPKALEIKQKRFVPYEEPLEVRTPLGPKEGIKQEPHVPPPSPPSHPHNTPHPNPYLGGMAAPVSPNGAVEPPASMPLNGNGPYRELKVQPGAKIVFRD